MFVLFSVAYRVSQTWERCWRMQHHYANLIPFIVCQYYMHMYRAQLASQCCAHLFAILDAHTHTHTHREKTIDIAGVVYFWLLLIKHMLLIILTDHTYIHTPILCSNSEHASRYLAVAGLNATFGL